MSELEQSAEHRTGLDKIPAERMAAYFRAEEASTT